MTSGGIPLQSFNTTVDGRKQLLNVLPSSLQSDAQRNVYQFGYNDDCAVTTRVSPA